MENNFLSTLLKGSLSAHLDLRSHHSPLCHAAVAILASKLLLKPSEHVPASGASHNCSLSQDHSCLKYPSASLHSNTILSEAFNDHPNMTAPHSHCHHSILHTLLYISSQHLLSIEKCVYICLPLLE